MVVAHLCACEALAGSCSESALGKKWSLQEKACYKEAFEGLRELKHEIEHLQLLLEQSRMKLQRDFEQWLQLMLRQQGTGSAGAAHNLASPSRWTALACHLRMDHGQLHYWPSVFAGSQRSHQQAQAALMHLPALLLARHLLTASQWVLHVRLVLVCSLDTKQCCAL